MQLMEAKTEDFVKEKHVPYIEKQDGGFLVKVGKETAHPMADDHYIVYIEICADGVQMITSNRFTERSRPQYL